MQARWSPSLSSTRSSGNRLCLTTRLSVCKLKGPGELSTLLRLLDLNNKTRTPIEEDEEEVAEVVEVVEDVVDVEDVEEDVEAVLGEPNSNKIEPIVFAITATSLATSPVTVKAAVEISSR